MTSASIISIKISATNVRIILGIARLCRKNMSKLEELIRQYCPDGVEYKQLKSILKIRNGKDYKHLGVGSIPVYGSGGVMTCVDTPIYDKPSVLIPRKGSIDKLYYVDTPFWNVDTVFYTEIDKSFVVEKYVFYALQKEHLEKLNTAGGVPSLTQAVLNSVVIPVPPLPVQEEIVRILDTFTELQAELQAELQKRKLQYNYYRDYLLTTFTSDKKVKECNLGEIGTFARGNGLQKKDFTETGVGCIHYGQIYTRFGAYTDKTLTYVDEKLASHLLQVEKGNLVIACTSENVEDICKCVAWLGEDRICTGGHACVFKHKQNPKYISYFFQTDYFFKQKVKYTYGTKVKDIKPDSIAKVRILLPSLEEQDRIVSVLDNLYTLTNDLSSGLPAEMEKRRRQYEYYRDKLLSFKRKGA